MGAFGACLKTIIEEYHFKYRAVAEAVRYDVSYVSKWVNSDILPASASSEKICLAIAALASERSQPTNAEKRKDLRERLFVELSRSYDADEKAQDGKLDLRKKRREGGTFDRRDAVFQSLKQLRDDDRECKLTIFADLAHLDIDELLFLIDVLNYVRELGFHGGFAYLLLPEKGLDDVDDGRTCVALVNLFMVRSKVRLRCYHSLVAHTGLVILGDTFMYSAQCRGHGCWYLEDISYDSNRIGKLVRTVGRAIMPTTHCIFTEEPIDPGVREDPAEETFWRCHDRMLLGTLGLLFCSEEPLMRAAASLGAQYADRYKETRRSFIAALERGREVRCIPYPQALKNLVYHGQVFAGGAYLHLSAAGRLRYLQNMLVLVKRYPNLRIKVAGSYVVNEIKHSFLPIVLFDSRGCTFLTFPVDGVMSHCRVKDRGTRKALERGFELLWEGNVVELSDIKEVISDYFDECEAMNL